MRERYYLWVRTDVARSEYDKLCILMLLLQYFLYISIMIIWLVI